MVKGCRQSARLCSISGGFSSTCAVMDQQHSCQPGMHLDQGDDEPATLLITVDKAPALGRPFADIPNPYDNACSVLCNHPYGHRFNWFTRRFVSLSRIVSRRSCMISEKSVLPASRINKTEHLSTENQQPTRTGVKLPDASFMKHGPNVAFRFGDRKNRVMAEPLRFEDQDQSLNTSSTKTAMILNPATECSDVMHHESGMKTWLQSSADEDADDYPFGCNDTVPAKSQCVEDDLKELKQPSPKRHKKKKKTSKKKRSRKKNSILKDDDLEDIDKFPMTDTTMQLIKKDRKGKRITGRRAIPASREDLENPLTLVEDDEQGIGLQRRRNQNVEIMSDERFSTPTDGMSWNETIRDTIQKQLDVELEGSQYDPRRLQDLQKKLQANMEERSRAQVNKELQEINEEISKKTSRSDHWMHHPRIPNMLCCRFELPMDARILTCFNPEKYLSTYCVIPRKRRQLFYKVFTKYRGTENHLTFQNLPKALKDVFGEPIETPLLETVYNFSQVGPESLIEQPVFMGLAALTERFLCQKMPSNECVTKDKVEEMDFGDLDVYLQNVQITEAVEQLLYWIKNS